MVNSIRALFGFAAFGALSSAAAADIVFSPPNDWGMSVGVVRGKGVTSWRPTAAATSSTFMSIVEDRSKGTLDEYVVFNRAALSRTHGPSFKPVETKVALCNGIVGKMITFSATSATKEPLAIEQLYTGANGTFYVISYIRPAKDAEAPGAVKALSAPCPR